MDVNEAATEIMAILRRFPSPRHAAAAVAVVRACLHRQAGGDTKAKVKKMIAQDDKAALEIWATLSDNRLAN
jgi:hypothetical protein